MHDIAFNNNNQKKKTQVREELITSIYPDSKKPLNGDFLITSCLNIVSSASKPTRSAITS